MRRALSADRRPVFHRGEQIASVERHNDAMLMGLLARFDRLRAAGAAGRCHGGRASGRHRIARRGERAGARLADLQRTRGGGKANVVVAAI